MAVEIIPNNTPYCQFSIKRRKKRKRNDENTKETRDLQRIHFSIGESDKYPDSDSRSHRLRSEMETILSRRERKNNYPR